LYKMAALLTQGIPLIVGVGLFVVGFLQVVGAVHLPRFDQTYGAILGASGLGLLGFSWIVGVLSSVTGVSIARIIVGLAILAGIATGMALLSPALTSSGYTTGQRVGYGIAIVLLGITGLAVLRKTFA
jgi:hypothetical protein